MSIFPDRNHVSHIIKAISAQIIEPSFRKLASKHIREKAPGDFVTDVDEAAERALSQALTDALPGSLVVGEEAVAQDEAVLAAFERDRPVWVIDPVDGTRNFINHSNYYGTIVALVVERTVIMGWILMPELNVILSAEKGKGAWLGHDRLPEQTNAPPMTQQKGRLGLKGLTTAHRQSLKSTAKAVTAGHDQMGCSAHDYLSLATGKTHYTLSVFPKPWDHAAGSLILAETGRLCRRMAEVRAQGEDSLQAPVGEAYDPTDLETPILCASSMESWSVLNQHFRPHLGSGIQSC